MQVDIPNTQPESLNDNEENKHFEYNDLKIPSAKFKAYS
jgi:hypothetical protein